jgi:hypothetical protein
VSNWQPRIKETEKGWHDVAWGFLVPFPVKGEVDNTKRRLRSAIQPIC